MENEVLSSDEKRELKKVCLQAAVDDAQSLGTPSTQKPLLERAEDIYQWLIK